MTLKDILGEFMGVVGKSTGGLGGVLELYKWNAYYFGEKFCVALKLGEGWKIQLSITQDAIDGISNIIVDYYNLSIRCKYCLFIEHLL